MNLNVFGKEYKSGYDVTISHISNQGKGKFLVSTSSSNSFHDWDSASLKCYLPGTEWSSERKVYMNESTRIALYKAVGKLMLSKEEEQEMRKKWHKYKLSTSLQKYQYHPIPQKGVLMNHSIRMEPLMRERPMPMCRIVLL